MSAKDIWIFGAAGAALVSAFGVLSVTPRMERDIRNAVEGAIYNAGISNDFNIDVDGQDVRLKLKTGVSNPKNSIKYANRALASIGIPNRVSLPYGDWLKGPIAAIKISSVPSVGLVTTEDTANLQIKAIVPKYSVASASFSSTSPKDVIVRSQSVSQSDLRLSKACEDKIINAIKHRNIGFKFNSYKISRKEKLTINIVYKIITSCPSSTKIIVQGHSDNIGEEATNKLISLARAESTANVLIMKGMNKDRIIIKGLGSSQPIADNVTYRGRAKNRRIVFKIVPQ